MLCGSANETGTLAFRLSHTIIFPENFRFSLLQYLFATHRISSDKLRSVRFTPQGGVSIVHREHLFKISHLGLSHLIPRRSQCRI